MLTKEFSFKDSAEQAAVKTLTIAYQLRDIAKLKNNLEAIEANNTEIGILLYAWDMIGLDIHKIELQALKKSRAHLN